ncbi:hypothetical protein [Shewanella piezotolerans]|nr:hypothetical protein [Shewanella piezotolerans]
MRKSLDLSTDRISLLISLLILVINDLTLEVDMLRFTVDDLFAIAL